jgi:uncharacterized protein YcgI (DUF1989 family)
MELVVQKVIPPKTGLALLIKAKQHLRITDLEGKQVVDMALFNAENPREKLSTSYSCGEIAEAYERLNKLMPDRPTLRSTRSPRAPKEIGKDKLTEGDTLVSTICQPMNRSCTRLLYEAFGISQDGCLEILAQVLAPYGIQAEDVPDTFDVFMNYRHDCARGVWFIGEPVSQAGDYVEFRALMDCIVGLSNCPDDSISPCNGYHCTPVKVEVLEPSRETVPSESQ